MTLNTLALLNELDDLREPQWDSTEYTIRAALMIRERARQAYHEALATMHGHEAEQARNLWSAANRILERYGYQEVLR